MIRRPPRSTQSRSSAASDVYKRQGYNTPSIYIHIYGHVFHKVVGTVQTKHPTTSMRHTMSKRKRLPTLPSSVVADALDRVHPGVPFSEGAVEGIKTAVEQFLDTLAQEWDKKKKKKKRGIVQDVDVAESAVTIGAGLDEETLRKHMTATTVPKKKRKKKRSVFTLSLIHI